MFWLDAKNVATAEQDFSAIGTLCGVAEPSIGNVKSWLGSHSERWLLIIDNADSPQTDYANYIPSGKRGDILITTRVPECVIYGNVGSQLLDGLVPELAQSLLLQAAQIPKTRWKDMAHAATVVVEALNSHTLAIVQAGAYIRSNLCTIQEYPLLFREHRQRLLEFQSNQVLSTYGSVYATFEISAEYLQKSQLQAGHDALELLHIIAFLNNERISEEMFELTSNSALDVLERGSMNGYALSRKDILRLPEYLQVKWLTPGGRTRWRNARSILAALSIVKIEEDSTFSDMSLHPLLHAWAKERQDYRTRCRAWQSASTMLALLGCSLRRDFSFGAAKFFLSHSRACLSHGYENYTRETSRFETAQALTMLFVAGAVSQFAHMSSLD